MSSIYRKGRDGYYYYQTYIHNPETGKKDKRIFHSLGTKNSENAKQKQIELDAQYEKTFEYEASELEPLVAKPFSPQNVSLSNDL